MGILARLRQFGEDPRVVVRALNRTNLNALRAALADRVTAHGVDIEQIVFDDALESHLTPTDQASVARRLYHNRLGLALASRVESKTRWRMLAASLAGLAGVIAIELQIGIARTAELVRLMRFDRTSKVIGS